jgi:hypothetical protein
MCAHLSSVVVAAAVSPRMWADLVVAELARWWCTRTLPSVEQSPSLSVLVVPHSTDSTKATQVQHRVSEPSLQSVVAVAVTGATMVALSQLTHSDLKFPALAAEVAVEAAVDCRTLLAAKLLHKHCLLVLCPTGTAVAMQYREPIITAQVVEVLVKQVPIAPQRQCSPQLAALEERQTSPAPMCITQRVAAAQADTPITGLQVAQAAAETVEG